MSKLSTMLGAGLLTCLWSLAGPQDGVLADLSAAAFAQEAPQDDPTADDPFAAPSGSTPQEPDDPFGSTAEQAADPFGSTAEKAADPFGAPPGDDNPFESLADDAAAAAEPEATVPSESSEEKSSPEHKSSVATSVSGGKVLIERFEEAEKEEDDSALSCQQKIERALEEKVTMEMCEAPIMDLVSSLDETYGMNVVLDGRAFEDVGIPCDTPLTFRVREVSLSSALHLVLRDLDLTWTIHNEVLMITTPEEEENMLIPKVYEVSDLVICRDEDDELWADFDTLIDIIVATIQPDTWEDVGGPGSMEGSSFRGAESLVISQTYHIQREIEGLLRQLRDVAADKAPDAEPPLRKKYDPAPPPGCFSGISATPAPDAGGGMGSMGGGGYF